MIVGEPAAPLLATLHAACFPPAERWSAASMAELLRMPHCFGWIEPDAEGTPVGLALARIAVDEAELLTLGVLPSRRGNGHGGRILRAVSGFASERGAERLFLEVAVGNSSAIALYRRTGFNRAGLRRRYYPDGADALVLATPLPIDRPFNDG